MRILSHLGYSTCSHLLILGGDSCQMAPHITDQVMCHYLLVSHDGSEASLEARIFGGAAGYFERRDGCGEQILEVREQL
jgi:predicted esterase